MKASRYGIENLKYIINNFNHWIEEKEEDKDFSYRSDIYNGIINQYLKYIGHVYANVGGVYLQEIKDGDQGELYRSVPSSVQKEALHFIMNQIGNNEWLFNKDISSKIGISTSVSNLVDNILIKVIIAAPNKVVVSSTLADGDAYTYKECADDVYNFIWHSTIKRKTPNQTQMVMQREFVEMFLTNAELLPSNDGNISININNKKRLNNKNNLNCYFHSNYNLDLLNSDAYLKKLLSPIGGYEWSPEFRLFFPTSHKSEPFGYILQCKKLLKKAVKRSLGEEQAHYAYLLKKIENSLYK